MEMYVFELMKLHRKFFLICITPQFLVWWSSALGIGDMLHEKVKTISFFNWIMSVLKVSLQASSLWNISLNSGESSTLLKAVTERYGFEIWSFVEFSCSGNFTEMKFSIRNGGPFLWKINNIIKFLIELSIQYLVLMLWYSIEKTNLKY